MQNYVTLRIFYFLFYCSLGVAMPYLPVWYLQHGIAKDTIGLIVATAFLPKLFSNPLCAHIADVTGNPRPVMSALLAFPIVIYPIYLFTNNYLVFFIVASIINFLIPPVIPLAERIAIVATDAERPIYGKTRVWGSIGFAVGSIMAGYSINALGGNAIIIEIWSLLAVCFVLSHFLPRRASKPPPRVRRSFPLLEVCRDRSLMFIIVSGALVQASNGFLYSYSSIYWSEQGISNSVVGALWAVGVFSEIMFFYFGAPIVSRLGPQGALIATASMTGLRWVGLGSSTDITIMFIAQLLQCFTIAANNMAVMSYISIYAKESARTSAIALYSSLALGIFIFVAIGVAKYFYIHFGISGFYIMAIVSVAAVPIIWGASLLQRRYNATEERSAV